MGSARRRARPGGCAPSRSSTSRARIWSTTSVRWVVDVRTGSLSRPARDPRCSRSTRRGWISRPKLVQDHPDEPRDQRGAGAAGLRTWCAASQPRLGRQVLRQAGVAASGRQAGRRRHAAAHFHRPAPATRDAGYRPAPAGASHLHRRPEQPVPRRAVPETPPWHGARRWDPGCPVHRLRPDPRASVVGSRRTLVRVTAE